IAARQWRRHMSATSRGSPASTTSDALGIASQDDDRGARSARAATAVNDEPVDHEDVEREEAQRPERIGRHSQHLDDRVDGADRHADPANALPPYPHA